MTRDSSLSRRPPQKPSNPSDNRPASCKAGRQYRQLWTLYVDQATVGVSRTDLTGRFTLANRCYCEIVGYAQEELLGMRMQDITHPEDLHANLEHFQLLAQEGAAFVIDKRAIFQALKRTTDAAH